MAERLFPPRKLYKYPHMMPADVEIWERFLEKHAQEFDAFQYDVHVGQGVVPPPDVPEEIRRLALAVTRKRIDVVGHKADEVWLIEVKPDAGLSALGQLVGYKVLYERDFPTKKKIILACVTDNLLPDMQTLFATYGIRYFVV